ncbi:MAG: ABC transporter substrate-binding protein [Candidatus Sumerlaeaceae bacterium]
MASSRHASVWHSGGAVATAVWVCCFLLCASALAGPDPDTTRIVSLLPSFTEIAYELGAGDMIVGVSDFCRYPTAAQQKPRVGGLLNPNLERMVALQPTVVVLSNAQGDLKEKLEHLKITVRTFPTDTLEDVFRLVQEAGNLSGCQDSARALEQQLRGCLRAIESETSRSTPCRVILVVSRQPASLRDIYVAGPTSYLGQLVRVAGNIPVAPDVTRAYPPITKEEIVAANPDVILDFSLGEQGDNPVATQRHLAAWEQLSTLEAVKKKQIYALSDAHATIPGPFMCETARKIASFLANSRRVGAAERPTHFGRVANRR